MIELFDPARLAPRRDPSVALAGVALALTLAGIGGYAALLQRQLQAAQSQQPGLQAQLARAERDARVTQAPSAALLADLQRQVEALEAEAGGDGAAATADAGAAALAGNPRAWQWLDRLDLLAAADLSLQKIDIDRAGALRIEGLARSPQAVSRLLQAWDRQQLARSPVPARAIEMREERDKSGDKSGDKDGDREVEKSGDKGGDKNVERATAQLRFVLRATPPARRAGAPDRDAAASVDASRTAATSTSIHPTTAASTPAAAPRP